jgi:hypothetical protein
MTRKQGIDRPLQAPRDPVEHDPRTREAGRVRAVDADHPASGEGGLLGGEPPRPGCQRQA